ncbi:hypothetical protein [Desulfonatronospira thiodismutans]|uniref:O-linked N-acetylglucosamine transferase family protein n=1 Tax=Desulfonatronospira thiodismutans TaxID=488939 RepID=UPI00058EA8B4|nr:hypothetical protein [Desulfonatronospira thiodismutans]
MLDPFPFTGGLTSCEALWMGVPVVTMPMDRVVSRQSYAFLGTVGLSEFGAGSEDEYVRIAAELAADTDRLADLRRTMRSRMQRSVLMDIDGFTAGLEKAMVETS